MAVSSVGVQEHFKKAYDILSGTQESLNNYLIKLDDSMKVNRSDSCNEALAIVAESYVRSILLGVETLDPRFKSTFLQSGSYFDDTKVGQPDEFDFMAKLEHLSKPGVVKAVPTKLGFVKIVLEDLSLIPSWGEFLCETADDNGTFTPNVIAVSLLYQKFDELVQTSIKEVELPQNWQRSPSSLRHGPCSMLEFLIHDFPEGHDPLYLSIDLAPCITYPNYQSTEFPYLKFFNDDNYNSVFLEDVIESKPEVLLVPFTLDSKQKTLTEPPSWTYIYSEHTRVSFSMTEKRIFSQFAVDSVEKRLFRILKVLRDAHMRDDLTVEDWQMSTADKEYPDEPPSSFVQVTSVEQVAPAMTNVSEDDHSTSLAEGEVYIDRQAGIKDLLQTYTFKSLFFYTKLSEELWSPRSCALSGVVLDCLWTLFDVHSSPNSTVPNFFFDGYTGPAPRERTRTKILRSLVKVVEHLQLQTSLQ